MNESLQWTLVAVSVLAAMFLARYPVEAGVV
jgi:hypothetical protein